LNTNDFMIYDSHIHFNMKAQNILSDFENEVKSLYGFILILNSKKEKDFFIKNLLSLFCSKFPNSVLVIDFELLDEKFIKMLQVSNIDFGIKIHPRLSNLNIHSFERVYESIKDKQFNFIIVDCFYYGSNLENHINLEIAIYMAKNFPDKNILLAHAGGHKILDFMLYTRELKNIYYDLSLTCNYLVNTSVQSDIENFVKYTSDRVFFGSDYPDFKVSSALIAYTNIFEYLNLDIGKREQILSGNILSFLDKGNNYEK